MLFEEICRKLTFTEVERVELARKGINLEGTAKKWSVLGRTDVANLENPTAQYTPAASNLLHPWILPHAALECGLHDLS